MQFAGNWQRFLKCHARNKGLPLIIDFRMNLGYLISYENIGTVRRSWFFYDCPLEAGL